MAAALQAETAVHSHVHRALEAGATVEEIEHTLLVGVTTMGFPAMMTALSWARTALAAHAPPGAPESRNAGETGGVSAAAG